MVSWSDIQKWEAEPLFIAMDDFRDRREKAKELADRLYISGYRFQAEGKSAEAIRNFIEEQTRYGEGLVQQYAELMLACSDAGDNVSRVKIAIEECFEYARLEQLLIAEDGSVTISPERAASYEGKNSPNADHLALLAQLKRSELDGMIKDTLRLADEADTRYADQLRAIAYGQVHGEGRDAFSRGLPDLPDPSWNETTVALWWDSHTPEEQQHLIVQHPGIIGNTNGIDAGSRDQANRIYVRQLLAQTDAEINEVEPNVVGNGNPNPTEANRLQRLRDQRADLEAAQAAVEGVPGRQLLVVDISGDQTRIGVATGDVDTADYVTSYVPGMGTNARDSLVSSIANAENIIDSAIRNQEVSREQIAAITWIGYDAPPVPGDAALPDRAEEGASLLADFLEGVHASRAESAAGDPYMTVVGHSYGSTTSGMAADKIGHGVVDDVVLLGSPGAGVQERGEYNIDGNAYVSGMASNDPVQGLGPDTTHGVNPMTGPGFTHISNEGHQPEHPLDPLELHSKYLLPDKNGDPTPILKDISDIVVGGQKDPGEEG